MWETEPSAAGVLRPREPPQGGRQNGIFEEVGTFGFTEG